MVEQFVKKERGLDPTLALPINQPFELVNWWPSVVIKCKCTPVGDVVVVVGHGSSICKSCKKVYQINELDYSRITNHCRLDLGVMSEPQGGAV